MADHEPGLKPCPLCGGTDLHQFDYVTRGNSSRRVMCVGCSAEAPILTWNQRRAQAEEIAGLTGAITEDWLRDEAGFKWHEFDRQPHNHWLLWLGSAVAQNRFTSLEDLGIELAPAWWPNRNGDPVGDVEAWHCWLRSDTAGRYHRFIHVRYLRTQEELVALVEALTGQPWDPNNHFFGSIVTPEAADRIRREDEERLDRQLTTGVPPHARWFDIEKDDTRGRALPEHLQAHADQQREK